METQELETFELQVVLQEYADEVVKVYKSNLIKSDRLATEKLLNSVSSHIDVNGTKYEVFIDLLKYWEYVEWDTKPHFPPLEPLMTWIRVKPVIPRPDEKGKIPTEKQLAFLIGRKISQEGTQGSYDLTNALEEVNRRYKPKLERALIDIVGTGFNKWLINFF